MAELREADKDLLELTALEVPWSMVCGDLHCAFGSVEALARRILLLEAEGLLEIRGRKGRLEPQALQAKADACGYYEDPTCEFPDEFTLIATERGLTALDGRLDRQ